MIIKISENLIINLDKISHVYGNQLFLVDGSSFKLDEISIRNITKIAKAFEYKLFPKGDQENEH